MNLALHVFRKDLRQFWILLMIWFGLLLLNLAVDLDWVGQVIYRRENGFDHAANTWTGLLPVTLWILVAILPSLVVLTDSPARREGFLATRPLPRRDLFLAKIIFVFTLVIAPWGLLELVHLMGQGMPAWVIWRGTLERLMFTLPVAVGFSAYATLWPDSARWARSLGIIFGGYIVTGMTVSLVMIYFPRAEHFIGFSQAPAILYAYVFMLVLMGVAVWHARAQRGILARWGVLILTTLISLTAISFWPWGTFALRPADQAAANSLMSRAGFEISPRAFSLVKQQDAGGSYFNINLNLKTKPLPESYVVEWVGRSEKFWHDHGIEIRSGRVGQPGLFSNQYWNQQYDHSDYAAWSSEFPPDVLFRQFSGTVGSSAASVTFDRFPLPSSRADWTSPLALQAGLEARVFQWHKIADLPLTPGATANDSFGSWKLVVANPVSQQIFFQRRQIELATATDSRYSSVAGDPIWRMAYLIYDPVLNEAWLPSSIAPQQASRARETALAQYFGVLNFSSPKALTPAELARCRLVIFEKSWVGTVPETWQSPIFTIDEKLEPDNAGMVANGDPMSRAEFARRVAALKVPALDAPRRDVSLYLLEFLRLVDARRYYLLDIHDPQTRQLATFVPAQLDLLLAGLPVMGYASRECVINAIKLGATEAQKPVIMGALSREPELAEVLLARGWMNEAHDQVIQLAQFPRRLPLPALQALAWFHEPSTYPRLLEEFEANPSTKADDLLRTLPGLDASLGDIASRHWRQESLLFNSMNGWQLFGEPFLLAARYGDQSTLQRAYAFLNSSALEELGSSTLADALKKIVQMPEIAPQDRHDDQLILAWMRRHRPEDFIFNPALRQFVLLPNQSGGSTDGASNP